jgi:toxin ParE1/3/4
MKRYRLDHDAAIDLKSIHRYVARDNPTAADRLVHEFKQKFHLLGSQPLIGEARPELAANLRSFSVGSYVILYRPTLKGIEVARVLHAARDIGQQF